MGVYLESKEGAEWAKWPSRWFPQMQLRRLDLFSSGADEEWLSGGNALDCVCQGEARWLRAWSGRRQPVVGEWLDRRQQILGWVVTRQGGNKLSKKVDFFEIPGQAKYPGESKQIAI